jgi:hypothetical protein
LDSGDGCCGSSEIRVRWALTEGGRGVGSRLLVGWRWRVCGAGRQGRHGRHRMLTDTALVLPQHRESGVEGVQLLLLSWGEVSVDHLWRRRRLGRHVRELVRILIGWVGDIHVHVEGVATLLKMRVRKYRHFEVVE